jgi:CRP-like cAMP-binding protein
MLQYIMDREAVAVLHGSALFEGVPLRDLARDTLRLVGARRDVPAGRMLGCAGDPYRRLIILVSGRLVATLEEESGRSLQVAELRAPDAVAPGILFAPDPRLPVTLTASERCDLLLIDRSTVLELCRRRPRFLANLLGLLGGRIQGLAAALRTARWSSLRARLAAYLLEQCGGRTADRSIAIRLPHTREQIARLVGAERPSVSRSLSAMARSGLITCGGRLVGILDLPRLEREARGD